MTPPDEEAHAHQAPCAQSEVWQRKSGTSVCIDMTDPQLCLRTYLEGARDFAGKLPTEYHYRNVYDFVLREGRFFEPQPRPDSITLRHIGECFRNAFLTMMRTGLQYAEGYAVVGSKIPVLHAWNVDAEGSVIDSTWEPTGSAYFGVVLPLSIVKGAKTSVLDDFESGWPVLRESWTEMVAE